MSTYDFLDLLLPLLNEFEQYDNNDHKELISIALDVLDNNEYNLLIKFLNKMGITK